MKKNHQIDEKFRELSKQEVQAPEFVWPNIEKAIRPKSPSPWLFWLGGGMMVMALIFATNYLSIDKNASEDEVFTEVLDNNQIENSAQSTDNQAISINNTEQATTTEGFEKTATLSKVVASQSANVTEEAYHASVDPSIHAASESVGSAPQYSVQANTTIKGNQSENDIFFEKKGSTTLPSIPTNPNLEDNKAIKQFKSLDEKKTTLREIAALDLLDNNSILLSQKQSVWETKIKVPKANFPITKKARSTCFDFSEVGTVAAIETYGGLGYGLRTLSLTDSDKAPWKEARQNSENNRFAWTTGVNAMFLTKRFLVLRAGVQFTQQNEAFKQQDPLSVRTITVTLTDPVTGTTTSTTEEQVGFRNVKTYNRLSMIDVPISVGYEFRKGLTGFSISAGANVNAFFHKKGEILDENDQRTGLGNSDPFFKNNLGLSGTLSSQFFYTVTPTMRIFAEPYIQHLFKSASLDGQPIQQKYTFGGVKIGVAKAIW